MSGRVFVDASGYYAFIDRDEADHTGALRTFQRLTSDQAELYTTTFVVAEIHALIVNRIHRDLAERVLDGLYASSIRIIRSTERDETRAREIIHQQRDKAYSYTDTISFAVIERLHVRHAWTYDHHFNQYGFIQEP
jgi:uncharacterized protein